MTSPNNAAEIIFIGLAPPFLAHDFRVERSVNAACPISFASHSGGRRRINAVIARPARHFGSILWATGIESPPRNAVRSTSVEALVLDRLRSTLLRKVRHFASVRNDLQLGRLFEIWRTLSKLSTRRAKGSGVSIYRGLFCAVQAFDFLDCAIAGRLKCHQDFSGTALRNASMMGTQMFGCCWFVGIAKQS
jgi:hypothetical protein